MTQEVVIGSRGSALALCQSRAVAEKLAQRYPGIDFRVQAIQTKGDLVTDRPLADIGDKGLFVKEIQKAILEGQVHMAVHSLKDLPTDAAPGLVLGAVSLRQEARDVMVARAGAGLDGLPPGARLGTSSRRRAAQLRHYRADLAILDLRGNLDTRLRKLDEGQYEAIIVAAAGLQRLGLEARITQCLSTDICLPAPGQGALAVEAREGDQATLKMLETVHDEATYRATGAERAFLARLEGGCQIPIGAYAWEQDGQLFLEGMVASIDGQKLVRSRCQGPSEEWQQMGEDLAERLLEMGAGEILRQIWTPRPVSGN